MINQRFEMLVFWKEQANNQLNCDLLTYLPFKPADAEGNLYQYFKSLNCNFRK